MNSLKQVDDGIFSTKKDLKILESKNQAKILIVSDSHGAKSVLQHIIENHSKECDALMFAGDGAQDLLEILEDAHSNHKLKEKLPPTICFVKGNADPYQYMAKFNPQKNLSSIFKKQDFYSIMIPNEIAITVAGKKIVMVHGHKHGVYYSTAGLIEKSGNDKADVLIFGHTHVPIENLRGAYMVNPGSIALPREVSKPGFAYIFIQGKNVVYSSFFHQENRSKLEFSPFELQQFFYS